MKPVMQRLTRREERPSQDGRSTALFDVMAERNGQSKSFKFSERQVGELRWHDCEATPERTAWARAQVRRAEKRNGNAANWLMSLAHEHGRRLATGAPHGWYNRRESLRRSTKSRVSLTVIAAEGRKKEVMLHAARSDLPAQRATRAGCLGKRRKPFPRGDEEDLEAGSG